MKLGMIAYDHSRENFEKISNKGLEFVEFCVNFWEEGNDASAEFLGKLDSIKADLEELGLTTGSVGRWGGTKVLSDGKVNEAELAVDISLVEAAAKLGCDVYCTGCNYVEELSLYENYSSAIAYFERLIEAGKKVGVKIATVNCRWNNYLHSDPAWSVVHGYLKDLYIKFDPSHSIYAMGENYLTELSKWGERVAHIHIKGSLIVNGERYDDPPAGLDQTDWGSFMSVIYKIGYDRGLSLEPHSPTWGGELGDKGLDYSIDYMKKLIF